MTRSAARCHYCDAVLTRENRTRDHVVPRGRGGLDRAWNVVPSCRDCNTRKGMDWPTCTCERCVRALVRWRNGERVVVTRYTSDAGTPPVRVCLVACVTYGCPGGRCRWPAG